jgi:hypothetical protein
MSRFRCRSFRTTTWSSKSRHQIFPVTPGQQIAHALVTFHHSDLVLVRQECFDAEYIALTVVGLRLEFICHTGVSTEGKHHGPYQETDGGDGRRRK